MEISILCSDILRAQMLKRALGDWATVCYVHTSFEEFWGHSQRQLSTLYLMDVEKVCSPEMGLMNHPMYKKGEMNIIFFHTPETLPLMTGLYKDELSRGF